MKHVAAKVLSKNTQLKKQGRLANQIVKCKYLYMLLFIPIVFLVIFKYIPMFGNIIAFRRYQAGGSIFGEEWVGFRYFKMFITDSNFIRIFKNTLVLSILNIIFTFPMPIVFAILLNELRNMHFKKVVQTVSYLPHFLSAVVVVGMVNELLSPTTGAVNTFLVKMGFERINFLLEAEWFRPIYIGTSIWQNTGWNSIIYLAALKNIDPQLYEAAVVDGAGRFRKIWNITLPGLAPTIVILFIIAIGQIMQVGFEKALLLMNGANQSRADIIATYVYRMGLINNNYSYSTAIGLFEGTLGLIFLVIANTISSKFSETSLW